MRKIISSQAAGIGSYVIVFKKVANGSYELQGDMKEVEAKILQAIENAEQIYIGVLADDGSGLGTLESADIARGEEIQISSKSFVCTLNEEGEIEIEDNPGGGGGGGESCKAILITYSRDTDECDYSLEEIKDFVGRRCLVMVADYSAEGEFMYFLHPHYVDMQEDSIKFSSVQDWQDYLVIDKDGCHRHYPE